MTFNTKETSRQDANVVELYEYAISGLKFYQTSAAKDYVYNSVTWEATPIKRNNFSVNTSNDRANLKVEVQRDNAIAERFRQAPPASPVTLKIWRLHILDNDARLLWYGRVLSVDWSGLPATLNCEPITTSLDRNCLRRKVSKNCPNILYECGVNKLSYANAAVLSSVSSTLLSAAAFSVLPSGILAGGLIEWVNSDNLIEPRMIISHSGANIVISYPIPGMVSGANVTVYRGCNHTLGAGGCADFSNAINYGGQPFRPNKNPFGGSPIY